jgi:hypothetical protein
MSKGAPGSYTAIAFETGRILGLEAAAKFLEEKSRTWTKKASFNYSTELLRLAAEVRKISEPSNLEGSAGVRDSAAEGDKE